MRYSRKDAKAYAREHMKGIWAAALMPFKADLSIDEDGFRRNVAHWTEQLGIDGLFIAGKQGEFFSMSIEERKRAFELAVVVVLEDVAPEQQHALDHQIGLRNEFDHAVRRQSDQPLDH